MIKKFTIKNKKNKIFIVLVDKEDYHRIKQYKWHVAYSLRDSRYSAIKTTFKQKTILLHRVILKVKNKFKVVDHINGNIFDNRKKNLRICLPKENCRNKKLNKNSMSGYKGVTLSSGGTWVARIVVNKKILNLGSFKTKKEAANVYNKAAKKYFRTFACLNKINNKEGLEEK